MRSEASPSPPAETDRTGTPTAAAIEFSGVSKSFGRNRILQDLDLSVGEGEVFALLGANGAGKTTTINILTTLIRPDSGTVRISGVDVQGNPNEAKRHFSVTGQSAAVDAYLSTSENLLLLARLSGLTGRRSRTRVAELAERLSLSTFMNARVGSLSGGMRRRLDLALSLVVPVDVLILDEPTTGLDTRSRRELWQEIGELAAEGTTVFLTTQYLEEADALANRIGLLDRGRLAGLGSPGELKSRVGQETLVIRDAQGTMLTEVPTDGTVGKIAEVLGSLDPACSDATVTLHKPSLDDVFLSFTSADPKTGA